MMPSNNTDNNKIEYLNELYEPLCTLGTDRVWLVKNRDTGMICVKKYVNPDTIAVYDKLSDINNPHIEQVITTVKDGDKSYVITKYISGITVREYLEKNGVFQENDAVKYINALLDGLSAVHSMEIIHRDITPGNVIISDDGIIKLIDFGIARQMKPDQNKDTTILGTVGYAAPEQFGFRQSDKRTDIYAVGVLLNQMLTGSFPNETIYNGSNTLENVIKTSTNINADSRFEDAEHMKKAMDDNTLHSNKWSKERIGFYFMTTYSVLSLISCTSTAVAFILECVALTLYTWLSILVLFNYEKWDRKIFPFRLMPKWTSIVLRIVIFIFLFSTGFKLERYVMNNM